MNAMYKFSRLLIPLRSVVKSSLLRSEDVQIRMFTTSSIRSSTNVATQTRPRSSLLRYLKIFGISIGALTGTVGVYGVYKMRSMNDSRLDEYVLKEEPPVHKIARSIQNPGDNSGLKFTIYQYQTCPFCCKVRAFLDYYGFSYEVIEVNSVTHAQTKWSSYKKVPFLLVQDPETGVTMQLKDSTLIISVLTSVLTNPGMSIDEAAKGYPVSDYENDESKASYIKSLLIKPKKVFMNRYFLMNYALPKNRTKEDMVLERKWRRWVDDVYVHMLSPNVYRTMNESYQAFSWFSKAGNWEELFTTWERNLVIYSGTLVMYLIGRKLKKKYDLKDDVRESLYTESEVWLKNVQSAGGPFMGGHDPNLADLSIYGVLTAIEGCDAFADLGNNTKMDAWFRQMKNVVHSHAGIKQLSERGRMTVVS